MNTRFSQKEIKIIQETILRTICSSPSWMMSFPLSADVLVGTALWVEAHLNYTISSPHFAEGCPGSSEYRRVERWLVGIKGKPVETSAGWDHSRDPSLLIASVLLPAAAGVSLWKTWGMGFLLFKQITSLISLNDNHPHMPGPTDSLEKPKGKYTTEPEPVSLCPWIPAWSLGFFHRPHRRDLFVTENQGIFLYIPGPNYRDFATH